MDPYLENPALWSNVHGRMIVAIADTLSPLLLPKYQPIIEESVYRTSDSSSVMVGIPDIAIQKTGSETQETNIATAVVESSTSPIIVEIPVPVTLRQRFIEIRNTASQEVVTVIEVLSPVNKRGDGRLRYLQKRERILESQANLVEIDLLHKGEPMPTVQGNVVSHYRILVSPVQQRPQALLYPFNLSQTLPQVAIPLREGDNEPIVDFQLLLEQIYRLSGYEYSIDYSQPPKPGWEKLELAWIANCVNQQAYNS
ncbi:hypothetical protein N836_27680 [Leptolyngbya sp. Heron Island J]|nr:hypothetical protein N836_27680 [Leptolyngbya sp. Heron Island J]